MNFKFTSILCIVLALLWPSASAAEKKTIPNMKTGVTPSGIHFSSLETPSSNSAWLVMVHGFAHDQRYFEHQIESFKGQFNLLLIDLRGHGKSSNAGGPFGYEEFADDVQSVIKLLGIKSAHYIGSHTGATVGLIIALREPALFTALILEGGFANDVNMHETWKIFRQSVSLARENSVESALEHWWNKGPWFSHIHSMKDASRIQQHKKMVFDFEGRPWLNKQSPIEKVSMKNKLRKLQHAVLLINGEFDSKEFTSLAANLNERLNNATQCMIKDSGGFPLWESPKSSNKEITEFINKNTL